LLLQVIKYASDDTVATITGEGEGAFEGEVDILGETFTH